MFHASLDIFTDVFLWSAIQDEAVRRDCHRYGVRSFHDYLAKVADSEFAIVVDHVFEEDAWYEATRNALKARAVIFVAVRCALEILEERESARADRRAGMARWQHDRVHEAKKYDVELDTGHYTSDECAELILKVAEERLAGSYPKLQSGVARP